MELNLSEPMMTIKNVRVLGSIATFLLWMKTFYWMRLFSNFAYFIALIVQTLIDIKTFAIVVVLLLCGFSNFFYIVNKNTFDSGDDENPDSFRYVASYSDWHASNAFISMYLLSLGDFDMENYSKGHDRVIVWAVFLIATFLLLVVFMNMLIAIMGDTFANVSASQEENSLFEQC